MSVIVQPLSSDFFSHLDFTLIKLETGLWRFKIEIGRNEPLLHDHDTLDQASNTAGSFKMSNIGFDRSNIDV